MFTLKEHFDRPKKIFHLYILKKKHTHTHAATAKRIVKSKYFQSLKKLLKCYRVFLYQNLNYSDLQINNRELFLISTHNLIFIIEDLERRLLL